MRINHNISALKANNQLSRTNKLLDASLERLSSGYRINSAADDAAGLAISEKMRTQIAGLEQASRNAADGISVIQTAEGALIEVESMLQRMRELSVQSANGIYTTEDRIAIQTEIDQLSQEITRISDNTEFNTMTLLDGNMDRKSYSDNANVNLISLTDSVSVGKYSLNITQDARQAVIIGNTIEDFGSDESGTAYNKSTRKISDAEAGSINVNGEEIKIKAGDSIESVFEKLVDVCNKVDVQMFAIDPSIVPSVDKNLENAGYTSVEVNKGKALAFVSKDYGSKEKITVYCNNDILGKLFGISKAEVEAYGVDAEADLVRKPDPVPTDADYSQYENTATVSISGNKITVSDRSDFKMVFEVAPGTVGNIFTDATIGVDVVSESEINGGTPKDIWVTVLDAGPMDLQIGANEGQVMSVRIPKVTPATLGIDKINIATEDGAQEAIGLLDIAINEVSAIRSKLGAYQNRLEHSISNLDVTAENLTEAMSRIKDVNMATEMAEYTQKNVLAQAGTSMLAQANQRPQNILSLLQQ